MDFGYSDKSPKAVLAIYYLTPSVEVYFFIFSFPSSERNHFKQPSVGYKRKNKLIRVYAEGKPLRQEENLLKEWCERDEVDFGLAVALQEKFLPLLEEAHRKQGSTFDRVFLEQKKGTEIRISNSARLLNILYQKLDHAKFTTKEIKAISLHNEFLPLVEGFFATEINFLILTLIANGYDFYSTWKRKSLNLFDGLEGIEEEDLSTRVFFLKNTLFPELAKDERIIRKLRNSVAHLFYEINPNGDVRIGGEKVSSQEYAEYYDYLRNVAFAMLYARNIFYTKQFASLSIAETERIKNIQIQQVRCSCGYVNLLPEDRISSGQQFTCTKCNKPLVERKNS